MGDHFYINKFTFKSELPEEELEQAWNKFTSELDEDNFSYVMNRYYGFTHRGSEDERLHKYMLWMGDNETKHSEEVELLAKFVSIVIAPNTHTLIEVETGGNEMWGYLVVPGKTYNLNYSVKIDVNGTPLEEFLEQYNKVTTRKKLNPLTILGTCNVIKGKPWWCPICEYTNTEAENFEITKGATVECKRCKNKYIIIEGETHV